MDLQALHRFIVDGYDREELRTLCFDLGVNYDALRGEGTAAKALELILYLGRRRQFDELLAKLRQERPEAFGLDITPDILYDALRTWKEVAEPASETTQVPLDCLQQLLAALGDSNEWVRQEAARELAKFGEPVVGLLIAALKDSDSNVRKGAAWALGKIGETAKEALISALKDDDPETRLRAAEALGKIGDARAVEPLVEALQDSDQRVQRSAADALRRIGKPAVGSLLVVLKGSDSNGRGWAAWVLGKIGDIRAVKPLITVLEDSDRLVQEVAVEALHRIERKSL